MSTPVATYRIQLRGSVDFVAVAGLAPYLARLGVSHCYLSPITEAMPGSTHGYDVTDFGTIDPVLGGRDGFVTMARTLRGHDLKILLDIVPNHMAASPKNAWWRDVLEWGQASPRAHHFDIDWSAPKLLVPVLAAHYADALAGGEFQLAFDAGSGSFSMQAGDLDLPLTPPSYAYVLGRAGGHFAEHALRFASSSQGRAAELTAALSELVASDARALDAAVAEVNADKAALHELHEQQVWRLAHWRLARENLTYRRFFEISDLIGVRVEDPTVFEDVHACVFELVREGLIDGLRIDHIDGLADPLDYLRRLRAAVGDETYIVVEKILGPGEELRSNWPVAGTTGYEFVADLAKLFTRSSGGEALTRAYVEATGENADLDTAITAAKRRTFTRNLAGELDHLTHLAAGLAQADIATRDLGSDTLRRALVELAAAFPVYRTYVDAAGAAPEDMDLIGSAVSRARSTREVEDEAAFDFLRDLTTLSAATPDRQAAALGFATRFQQTTGPLMAKSLEDTIFYRFNRLIALNEVGCDASLADGSSDAVHASFQKRLVDAPLALSTTETHDTKRGEDARVRIFAIGDVPELWGAAVQRWMAMNAPWHSEREGESLPDPNSEWLYYQALLGAWPPELSADDEKGLVALAERMAAFMIKAAREAKLRTTWTRPDAVYETTLRDFVTRTLDPIRSRAFIEDFLDTARPLFLSGCATSLTQAVIKVLAPGVPDIYQGAELWDFSLVDPDNRRAVDYQRRRMHLDAPAREAGDLLRGWQDGAVKLAVIRSTLEIRRRFGDEIVHAAYVPLAVEGPRKDNIFAFARKSGERCVIVIGARFLTGFFESAEHPTLPKGFWSGTHVLGPPALDATRFASVFTSHGAIAGGRIDLDHVLDCLPVAVLTN